MSESVSQIIGHRPAASQLKIPKKIIANSVFFVGRNGVNSNLKFFLPESDIFCKSSNISSSNCFAKAYSLDFASKMEWI